TELSTVFNRNLKLGVCPRNPSIRPHVPPKVRPTCVKRCEFYKTPLQDLVKQIFADY
ncbi:7068_t:CDS:1, partial [Cetraspora pellucida]